MIGQRIEIILDADEPDFLTKAPTVAISKAMDWELKEFDGALVKGGNQKLNAFERTILKTYIAWKLGVKM